MTATVEETETRAKKRIAARPDEVVDLLGRRPDLHGHTDRPARACLTCRRLPDPPGPAGRPMVALAPIIDEAIRWNI